MINLEYHFVGPENVVFCSILPQLPTVKQSSRVIYVLVPIFTSGEQ